MPNKMAALEISFKIGLGCDPVSFRSRSFGFWTELKHPTAPKIQILQMGFANTLWQVSCDPFDTTGWAGGWPFLPESLFESLSN